MCSFVHFTCDVVKKKTLCLITFTKFISRCILSYLFSTVLAFHCILYRQSWTPERTAHNYTYLEFLNYNSLLGPKWS